jgi:hypothetical protein
LIAFIITVVVLLVVLGIWLWRRKQTADPAVIAAKQELSEHSKALKVATKERDDSIKNCQRQLADAQKKHSQYVSSAQRKLTELEDPKGKQLGSYHGVRLFERWIETPHGSGPVRDTVASVDSQIASRITATRLVTLGVFALAAKKKTGAIYLSIDNPALASVVECPKDDNTRARQFAVQITNAGKAAAVLEEKLPALIEEAKATLKAQQGATGRSSSPRRSWPRSRRNRRCWRQSASRRPRSLRLSRSWLPSPPGTRRRRSPGRRKADGHNAGLRSRAPH